MSVATQLVTAYLRHLEADGKSDSARYKARQGLDLLVERFPQVTEVSSKDLAAGLAALAASCGPSKLQSTCVAWRGFYRWASSTGWCEEDPAETLSAPKPTPTAAEDTPATALRQPFRLHLMARGLAQGTIAQRLRHFDLLAVRFPDLSIVTTPDLEHVLAQMVMTGKASETRKAMLSTMRVLFRWLYRSGRAVDDPASDLAPIAVHVRQARIASDDDVAAGLITASLPAKVAVLLGRYAGLRLSEISRVHTNDRDGDVLRVLGKGSRERLVPLNSELLEVMMRLETVQGPGPLFPGRWSAHATPSMVSDLIKTATGWNPHSLRHAAATAAYRGTRDMRAVQEFLGHASVQTTQRYVRVGFDDVRAAAAATSLAGVGRTDEALAASAIERAY